jgi:Zn-dependent protease with chaperone function
MAGVFLLLVALSALAWLGGLRRWSPRPWILCAILGGLVGIAVLPAAGRELQAAPLPVILVACFGAMLAGCVAWLFFCRLLPARRKMRFFYHGAFVIVLGGIGVLFPFRGLWQERLSPADNQQLSETHRGIAGKFGLQKLNISVLGGQFPTAYVTSFSGDAASIVVSSSLNDMLKAEEMQFVIAHELSHHQLKHYPARVLLAVAALLFYFLATWLMLRRRDPKDPAEGPDSDGGQELEIFLRRVPMYLLVGVLAALGPLAYCRAQETEADLLAVKITGNARAARATLEKLAQELPSRRHNRFQILSLHPCLQERIERVGSVD